MPTCASASAEAHREIKSLWALGIVIRQRTNLKKLAEGHHKEWIMRLNLTQRGTTHQSLCAGDSEL
jgi:hypothetical protein